MPITNSTKLQEKELEIQNLKAYNQTLLEMYDSVRVFKHNFYNFVQALEGYIMTNDMEGIKEMCSSVCKECKIVNNMGILSPQIINNPAIYSIISNKFSVAREKNIEMNIEVMLDFQSIEASIYDLSNILGILLDNEIDAASSSVEKIINVKFMKDLNTQNKFVIVENTYNETNLDIGKIFEKGYSTKIDDKEEHGLGLWNVKNMISHSDDFRLYTTKGKMFSQKLEICDMAKVVR